jgi:hypothetical protein
MDIKSIDNKFILVSIMTCMVTLMFVYLNIKSEISYNNDVEKHIKITHMNKIGCEATSNNPDIINNLSFNPINAPSSPATYPSTNDIIKDYDYSKLNDDLVEPTRRVPRHEIHPRMMKQMIDLPTRGYPDNFIQMGTLIKDHDHLNENDNNNNIIRLFGRQEYPGSCRYEYYAMVNSGHDQIKIPINTRNRKELYDNDKLYIDELKNKYEIKLHKFDAPKYYPDIIY